MMRTASVSAAMYLSAISPASLDSGNYIDGTRICRNHDRKALCGLSGVPGGVGIDFDGAQPFRTLPVTISGLSKDGVFHAIIGPCHVTCSPAP